MDGDIAQAAVRQRGSQLVRRPGQDRERAVVERDDVLHAEQLHGQRRRRRVHREVPTDRQHGEIRVVQVADQRHVAEDLRVAGVIDAVAILELHDEARRIAEIQGRFAAGFQSPAE